MLLCHLDDLIENQGKGFDSPQGKIILIKRQQQVFAWLNMCPHLGIQLEWEDDHFMDFENYFLQCASHGALFQVEDGYCVGGPCIGKSLIKVTIEINDNQVFWRAAKE